MFCLSINLSALEEFLAQADLFPCRSAYQSTLRCGWLIFVTFPVEPCGFSSPLVFTFPSWAKPTSRLLSLHSLSELRSSSPLFPCRSAYQPTLRFGWLIFITFPVGATLLLASCSLSISLSENRCLGTRVSGTSAHFWVARTKQKILISQPTRQ